MTGVARVAGSCRGGVWESLTSGVMFGARRASWRVRGLLRTGAYFVPAEYGAAWPAWHKSDSAHGREGTSRTMRLETGAQVEQKTKVRAHKPNHTSANSPLISANRFSSIEFPRIWSDLWTGESTTPRRRSDLWTGDKKRPRGKSDLWTGDKKGVRVDVTASTRTPPALLRARVAREQDHPGRNRTFPRISREASHASPRSQ